jgi:hypothetical protein
LSDVIFFEDIARTLSHSNAFFVPQTTADMFGGPPPPPSAAELKAQESEASLTVQKVIVGAILLYLSPFAIDAVKKLV